MTTDQAQLLSDFIDNIAIYTQIENTDGSPMVVRRTNPRVNTTTTFVASSVEPVGLLLPVNVIWIQFDSAAPDYRWVYRRDSMLEDLPNNRQNTWVRIFEYKDLWDLQFYDPDDLEGNTDAAATDASIGVVRISVSSTTPGDPIVIVEGDETLTNARIPLPHRDQLHPEIPATRLATTGRAVIIENGQPLENAGMIADFQGDSAWNQIPENAIYPDVTPFNPLQAKVFGQLENTPISADIIVV